MVPISASEDQSDGVCCFSKLKQFRRVATCFEKAARNHLAIVTLAAVNPLIEVSARRT